jgi:hypothetical protein
MTNTTYFIASPATDSSSFATPLQLRLADLTIQRF